jgi:hypothetical protein
LNAIISLSHSCSLSRSFSDPSFSAIFVWPQNLIDIILGWALDANTKPEVRDAIIGPKFD